MTTEPISKLVPGQTRLGVPGIEVGERGTLTANNSGYLIYQVTSGRKLKLTTLIVTNERASSIILDVFDATSSISNRILHIMCGAERTEVYKPEELIGVKEAISGIYCITTLSGTEVHVGGCET